VPPVVVVGDLGDGTASGVIFGSGTCGEFGRELLAHTGQHRGVGSQVPPPRGHAGGVGPPSGRERAVAVVQSVVVTDLPPHTSVQHPSGQFA
jgi:hypothetical protein